MHISLLTTSVVVPFRHYGLFLKPVAQPADKGQKYKADLLYPTLRRHVSVDEKPGLEYVFRTH